MELVQILQSIDYTCNKDISNLGISDIIYDSRKVVDGCVFVCLKGAQSDGHKYAKQAIEKGAVAVVAQDEIDIGNTPLIITDNTRRALAFMSAEFFCHPAKELKTIGITGTKGKTTTSCMIKAILEKGGYKTGLIGTLGVIIGNDIIKTDNTTPESYDVQKYMRMMVDCGCKAVVMEVSSLGLKWHRIDAFDFDYGIFTNFSADHIGENEHESLEEYAECKSMLFRKCNIGIFNKDDSMFEKMLSKHTCQVATFGFDDTADFVISNDRLVSEPGYLGVNFDVKGKLNFNVNVDIPGKFSAYNAIAAIAACYHFGISEHDIIMALNEVKVKGRLEPVKVPGNFTLLIDYAHNAMSMISLLNTLRQYKPNRLVTMFGAGGNRARSRRYEMGEASGKLSDLSVITADNSRNEDVMDIIEDIKVGIAKTTGKFIVIPDRKSAIKYCIETAQDGDIIVLAGKGHEDYQEIKGVKHHFDEREIIKDIINELKEK